MSHHDRLQAAAILASTLALTASLAGASPAPQTAGIPPGSFGPPVVPKRVVTVGDMTATTPLPPSDIYRPSPTQGATHHDFATFAWLEFIALSAEAMGARGVPTGSFLTSGTTIGDQLVWHTFYHRSELFPFGDGAPAPPQPFDSMPTYVYGVGSPRTTYTTPFNLFNNLDEGTQIFQNFTFFPAPGESDSQVLYEAKANYVEWEFINNNWDGALTNIEVYKAGNTIYLDPPITQPSNVMEVKASWRPLADIPLEDTYRYHIREVIVYDGTDDAPVASTELYALIGLHIIVKTPNYPTLIYATFEHADALEDPRGDATDLYYIPTYEEIVYTTPTSSFLPPTNETIPNPPILFDPMIPVARPNGTAQRLPVGPVSMINGAQMFPDGVHVPVVQPPSTTRIVKRVNNHVLQQMKMLPGFDQNFVWQYYALKGVQGMATSDETTDDYYLADITIENSQPGVQLFRGGAVVDTTVSPTTITTPVNRANIRDDVRNGEYFSMGGCMGCHGIAQTQNGFDFSFLYFGANGGGFGPDTRGIPSSGLLIQRLARSQGLYKDRR